MDQLVIAEGKTVKSNAATNYIITDFSQWAKDKLKNPPIARKGDKYAKTNNYWFIGAESVSGGRLAEDIGNYYIATIDADDIEDVDVFKGKVDAMFGDYQYAMYTTFSHTIDTPKYRVVIPLARPLTQEEYKRMMTHIRELFGYRMGVDKKGNSKRFYCVDSASAKDVQIMFYPLLKTADSPYEFKLNVEDDIGLELSYMNPDKYLQGQAPAPAPAETVKSDIEADAEDFLKNVSSKDRPALIKAFSLLYPMEQAMEHFIPDAYHNRRKQGKEIRYTLVNGTSEDGFIIYPDGHASTKHSNDPMTAYDDNVIRKVAESKGWAFKSCCENIEPFDLIRVHLYGHMDYEKADKGTLPNQKSKYPSYKALQSELMKDKVFKKCLSMVKANPNQDFSNIDFYELAEQDWEMDLDYDEEGKPLNTQNNYDLILSKGDMEGVLAYNYFESTVSLVSEPPFTLTNDENYKGEISHTNPLAWRTGYDSALRNYLRRKHALGNKDVIKDTVIEVARNNQFHPILSRFEHIEWDGIERAESYFIDMVGTPDTPENRYMSRKWLLAAIYRMLKPACKFDQMLVLTGKQGTGKSTALSRLGYTDFHAEGPENVKAKESGELLKGKWIIEFAEMSIMYNASPEDFKNFISKITDRYRPAYETYAEDFPRVCVLAGSTNETEFLIDKTGNRRFWIMETTQHGKHIQDKLSLDTKEDALKTWAYINQLWAEVLTWYKAGEKLYEGNELMEARLEEIQKKFTIKDDSDNVFIEWLEEPQVPYGEDGEKVILQTTCTAQIKEQCLNIGRDDARYGSRKLSNKIINALIESGKWRLPDTSKGEKDKDRFGKYKTPQKYLIRVN